MEAALGKTRIVFVLNDFFIGGMQRQFAEQMRWYDRTRFDISLVTLFHLEDKETLYDELPKDLPVHQLHFRGVLDVSGWFALYRLLRTIRPQIVVSSLFFANMVARALRPLVGYVSIAREHNTYIHKPRWQQYVDRSFAPLSYCIVAVSKTVADFTATQERIPREKFLVIHNGIDTNRARSQLAELPDADTIRRELGIEPGVLMLLNVARLTTQKRHDVLLQGFARFRRAHPRASLAVVGDGAQRPALEAQAEALGVADAVRFFGMRDDVWRFYKCADFLISASEIEGFSNAYLEALAAGLPIVATLTAGTDEFLAEGVNGYIIRGSAQDDVADALERAATAGQHLREAALRTAERFSLQKTVEAYESLFEKAVR